MHATLVLPISDVFLHVLIELESTEAFSLETFLTWIQGINCSDYLKFHAIEVAMVSKLFISQK